jgi:hypothetical protein
MPALAVPQDGRLTSQNEFSGSLTSTDLFYLVSPGNAAAGNSYKVQAEVLADYFATLPTIGVIEVTSGSLYTVGTTDGKVLVNKNVGSATSIVLPIASTFAYPFYGVFIKDLKGDAATNNITVSFTGGENCDGMSSIVIGNPYGWVALCPHPNGSGWYQTQ